MRKFIFLITILLLATACISVSGWINKSSVSIDDETNNGATRNADSLAKKYFPLKIGNSWTYKSFSILGDTSHIRCTVLSDTIINNFLFYRLSRELPYFEGKLITLDTNTGNLYSYSDGKECSSYRRGTLLDSLGSNKGDKILSCSDNRLYGRCIDTGKTMLFSAIRNTKFFLSPASSGFGLFNRFADGIGITFASKIAGSGISAAFLTGCVLNNVVYGDTSTTTHIFGTVQYSDNNQPASNGYVKAMQLNRTTGDVIVLDSVQIQPGGFYYFRTLPHDSYYIVAYPNSEEECDYVPTYYPSTINWQNAVKVNTGNNPEHVKISIFRKSSVNGSFSISGRVSSQVNQLFNPLKDVNVYLKQGNIFRTFNITKNLGQYKLNELTSGNYEIVVNRLGYVNLQQSFTVNNSNLENINFFLEPTFIKNVSTADNVPEKYNLSQNYPNPFNPVTNIKFDLLKGSFVTLKVYDITGKESATLVNEFKAKGSYLVDFNASNLSSGIYFYKLKTNDFNETKRMIVVK